MKIAVAMMAAALFGRRFDPDLVASLLDRSVEDVLAVLRRCADLQLVSVDAAAFQFRHALTREAVLAGTAPSTRTVLARRACAVLEETYPGLPGAWCELAAQLSLLAGDPDAAARLLLTAGRRAVAAQGALVTAGATLDRARALARDGSPRGPESICAIGVRRPVGLRLPCRISAGGP